MDKEEKLIKKVITVYTEIERKTGSPTYKFPQGGAAIRTVSEFLKEMRKEYGALSIDRIVDYCIFILHYYHDKDTRPISHKFGKAAIKRFRETKVGKRWHEDMWLEKSDVCRSYFYGLAADKSLHPQAKYIHLPHEENTKQRLLNQEVGYLICQASTLGWSPLSGICSQCNFTDRCMKETEVKYPELYRLRVEHGNKRD